MRSGGRWVNWTLRQRTAAQSLRRQTLGLWAAIRGLQRKTLRSIEFGGIILLVWQRGFALSPTLETGELFGGARAGKAAMRQLINI